jgi:hypothetical protein
MQQDNLDGRKKRPLRRLFIPAHPSAKILVGYFEVLCQLADTAQHEAGAVQRARVNARMLRRRQRAVFRGCGHLSHKRYRAMLSTHTQVAIIERVLSFFGHRRVA